MLVLIAIRANIYAKATGQYARVLNHCTAVIFTSSPMPDSGSKGVYASFAARARRLYEIGVKTLRGETNIASWYDSLRLGFLDFAFSSSVILLSFTSLTPKMKKMLRIIPRPRVNIPNMKN